jgi:hypothetical protein
VHLERQSPAVERIVQEVAVQRQDNFARRAVGRGVKVTALSAGTTDSAALTLSERMTWSVLKQVGLQTRAAVARSVTLRPPRPSRRYRG